MGEERQPRRLNIVHSVISAQSVTAPENRIPETTSEETVLAETKIEETMLAGTIVEEAEVDKLLEETRLAPSRSSDVAPSRRSATDHPHGFSTNFPTTEKKVWQKWQKSSRLGASLDSIGNAEDHGDNSSIKVGSFQMRGNSGRQQNAEIAFWPANKNITQQKVMDLFYNCWKVKPPNLLLNVDAGAAHPTQMSTAKLRQLDQYVDWCAFAQTQIDLHGVGGRGDASSPLASPSSENSEVSSLIDGLLFDRLVTVFAALLDASALTNNWIVINRTSSSSPTAEFLLELALTQTDAKPIIVVIDSEARLRQFFSSETHETLDMLTYLEANCIIQGSDAAVKRADVDAFYSPYDFEGGNTLDGKRYTELPVPRIPDEEHVLPEGQGAAVEVLGQSKAVNISPKRLWSYHYRQHLFASGTHYIILREKVMKEFPTSYMGSMGGIFAHGGTKTAVRMRRWLQRGRPTVMLYNTGGVTQAYASLHTAVIKRSDEDPTQTLKHVQIVSNEKWTQGFGLREIVIMNELKKRAPMHLRKAVVSVDILKDSAEEVLHVVTGCFAAATGNLPELGLRGAEIDVVMRAWAQHMDLWKSAAKQRWQADLLFYISMFLLFFTSLLASLNLELYDDNDDNASLARVIQFGIILVPILSGLVATMIQRKRSLRKWGSLSVGAAQIVAEIYKFRSRAMEYDTDAEASRARAEMEDNGGEESAAEKPKVKAREIFVDRIQRIFTAVMTSDMSNDSLSQNGKRGDPRTDTLDVEELHLHVQKHLLRIRPPPRGRTEVHPLGDHQPALTVQQSPSLGGPRLQEKERNDTVDIYTHVDEDDLNAPVTIETYMEWRMKPVLAAFNLKAPRLGLALSVLENLVLLLTSLSMVLGIVQWYNWVTTAVSIRAIVSNIMEYEAVSLRLGITNKGIHDLQNLRTWWDSLSVIDRRTRMAKNHAVMVLEQAVLNQAMARTSETAFVGNQGGQDREGNGEGERETEGGGNGKRWGTLKSDA